MRFLNDIGAGQMINCFCILLYLVDRLMIGILQQRMDCLPDCSHRFAGFRILTAFRIAAVRVIHNRIKMLAEGLLIIKAVTAETIQQRLIGFFPNRFME